MGLALNDFLDGCYETDKKSFYKLVDSFGMKIPIVAAQREFRVHEVAYITLPPFILHRYRLWGTRSGSMGKVKIEHTDENTGLYLVIKGDSMYWLPGFMLHRNHEVAEEMFRKQLEHMIEVAKQEKRADVSPVNQTYKVPIEFLEADERRLDAWFYEEYKIATLADTRQKTKSLGF